MLSNIIRKRLHKILWRWLARNPRKFKDGWPWWFLFKHIDFNSYDMECFACGACDACENCPLDWTEGTNLKSTCTTCKLDVTFYGQWNGSMNKQRRSELALKISNMKWKDKK